LGWFSHKPSFLVDLPTCSYDFHMISRLKPPFTAGNSSQVDTGGQLAGLRDDRW
jgi:predicted phosphatase